VKKGIKSDTKRIPRQVRALQWHVWTAYSWRFVFPVDFFFFAQSLQMMMTIFSLFHWQEMFSK